MSKKKKNPQKSEPTQTPLPPDRPQPLFARNAAFASVAILFVLWLIQYISVLTGGGNLWEDVVQLEYPFRYFTRAALMQGEFPHWNPYTFGGMPFYATGAGIFYPLNLLTALLPVSDAAYWRIIQAIIVAHILIAGVTMFAYLRFKGRTNAAAVFGATAFMFGGYMITHVIHLSIIVIVAWLPLLLLLLERGVREANMKYAVIGGLVLGAVMQAGHAQVMFYAIGFLFTYAAYFVLTCLWDRRPGADHGAAQTLTQVSTQISTKVSTQKSTPLKHIIPATVFFAIAAGLCLVQYLPMFEAGAQTSRISYTMEQASEGSLQFAQLITALMPKFFGAYTGGEGAPVFWLQDSFSRGAHIYWESSFYFGLSTLILAVFMFRKIRKDRSVMFKAGWALLSFLIALGGNFFFYRLLFSLGIPGFNSFRHTPRILFIWGFLFPVMAAAVLDSLDDLKSKRLKITSLSICAAAALLGIIAASGGFNGLFAEKGAAPEARWVSGQGNILLINALLLGIALTLFFTNKIKINTAKILITACLAIDMLVFAAGQHITRHAGADAVFASARNDVEHIRKLREDETFRVNTRQFVANAGERIGHTGVMLMERNQGYVSGIETTDGYNPFRLKYGALPLYGEKLNVLLDLFNIKYYVNPRYRGGNDSFILANDTYLPRAKLFYRAKVIDNGGTDGSDIDSRILDYMNGATYDHRNEVVVIDPALSRFNDNGGRGDVRITNYKRNRIELDVDTDKEAILWLSEIWFPAWKASVNGNRTDVLRANHSFRAIAVPAGQSKVVFKFDSPLFNIGMIISLLTLAAALGYLLADHVKRKKSIPKNIVPET